MSHTIDELLDQNGNYDINRGYKYNLIILKTANAYKVIVKIIRFSHTPNHLMMLNIRKEKINNLFERKSGFAKVAMGNHLISSER